MTVTTEILVSVCNLFYSFKFVLQGVSFLEVKNHLLLSYFMNMTHLMSDKLHGKSIQGSSAIDRLVEIRTVSVYGSK